MGLAKKNGKFDPTGAETSLAAGSGAILGFVSMNVLLNSEGKQAYEGINDQIRGLERHINALEESRSVIGQEVLDGTAPGRVLDAEIKQREQKVTALQAQRPDYHPLIGAGVETVGVVGIVFTAAAVTSGVKYGIYRLTQWHRNKVSLPQSATL